MILDHIGFAVSDYEGAKAFYSAALRPLGIPIVMEVGQKENQGHKACGYGGPTGKPDFWLGSEGRTTPHVHVCFAAETRAAVDAFYKAAMAAGAKDNGTPGIRAHYHSNYYDAFVLDPEGRNIEAVCHKPA